MNASHESTSSAEPITRRRWWRSPWLVGGSAAILTVLLAVGLTLAWYAHRAEPMLRARVIKTLSERFHSPVELDELHVTFLSGLGVEGSGLRILYIAGPTKPDARAGAPPMLTIRSFQFRSGLRELFEPTLRVLTVEVQGAELHIPPKEDRGPILRDDPTRRGQPREGILVDKIVLSDLKIVIETRKPGKVPLEFDIGNLTLTNVGLKQPLTYDATLRNPKPVGDVRAVGHFGPWQDDNPRDTPLDGSYIFSHADLSTIKGIGGMLSSNGKFAGTLGEITIDGVSDTPDFRLTISNHAVPLHTSFHAIVDATSGDTYLQPVNARLLHSDILATGSVTRQKGVPGHDVELDIVMNHAHVEDLLTLAVRTYPPVLRGYVAERAHLSIPPGPGSVTRRMHLQGSYDVEQGSFSNAKLQQQIDELSQRAQGWPERANAQQAVPASSTMKGSFTLADEHVSVPEMHYEIPGAKVQVEGQYGLDGAAMDFHGTVRTQATASQMVGGWKSLLVMPFDGLLKRNGAGVEVPFKLGGTQKDPKLALDFPHNAGGLHVVR
ncbi:AsmA-like C-terminal region-containing protein [Granulicella arctica]|uniref:AsmA-like C-terminal region-containing protein n=1 Tax=Granulicella arctica TaxID=940613 RepID=UPI0021DF5F22|nr:AsmA-like C-terminal region-containing protein [Granulicella arctica]